MSNGTFDEALQELSLAQEESDLAIQDVRRLRDESTVAEARRATAQTRLATAQAVFLESGLKVARDYEVVTQPL